MSKFPFDRDNTSDRYANNTTQPNICTGIHEQSSQFLKIEEDFNRKAYDRPKGRIYTRFK